MQICNFTTNYETAPNWMTSIYVPTGSVLNFTFLALGTVWRFNFCTIPFLQCKYIFFLFCWIFIKVAYEYTKLVTPIKIPYIVNYINMYTYSNTYVYPKGSILYTLFWDLLISAINISFCFLMRTYGTSLLFNSSRGFHFMDVP